MILAVTEGAETTGGAPTVGRIWQSDDGTAGTWEELTPSPLLTHSTSLFFGRLGSHYGVLLWGQNGPQPGGTFDYTEPFVIGRSEDHGRTWSSAVDVGAFPDLAGGTSNFNVSDFLSFSALIVVALGTFTDDGFSTSFGMLRSEDGGKTFFKYRPVSLSAIGLDTGINLGNGLGLVTGPGGGAPEVWKTEDAGLTFSSVTLPTSGASNSRITTFVRLASGRLLAVGDMNLPPGFRNPVVWYTDDPALLTWTVVTAPVPGLATSTYWHQVDAAGAVGDRAVLGMVQSAVFAGPDPDVNFKVFRVSEDGGVTWNIEGTYSDALPISQKGAIEQFAVADDGAVLAIQATLGGASEGETGVVFTIWRGVLTSGAAAWTNVYQAHGTAADFACRHGWLINVANSRLVISPNPAGGAPCVSTVRGRVGVCIDTLTDDDIIRGRWQAGDRLIINRVIFSIDWDYLAQQFTKHVVYTFEESVRKYGLRPAMRIESKGIRSTPTACGADTVGCGIAMLDERAFNLGARYADPPPMLNLEIFYRKHTWEPGDIICVTSAFVPNILAGVRGITAEAFEIINIQQQFAPEGKIILTLLDVEAITLPPAPTVIVAEDEVALLNRLRGQQVRLTAVPPRAAEIAQQRSAVARFRRGLTQPGEPPVPASAPRREVLTGGSRGIAPTVP